MARSGDTAAVAGIRAEILDAKSIPNPPAEDDDDIEKIRKLGLLVPNVEFATGSGKKWLPGGAPGTSAQSIAFKVLDLLLSLELFDLNQLEIRASNPIIAEHSSSSSSPSSSESSGNSSSDDSDDAAVTTTTQQAASSHTTVIGYWTLYIDITLISSAGSLLPTLWAALLGALRTTCLPHAYRTHADAPIVCSSLRTPVSLTVRGMPIICSFGVFEPAQHKGLAAKSGGDSGDGAQRQAWVLAEPDELEEEVCTEELVVVIDCSDRARGTRILRVEKSGGSVLDRRDVMDEVFALAVARWGEWNAALDEIGE